MKTRKGLVSNSSSSSFVVRGPVPPSVGQYVPIYGKTRERVCQYVEFTPEKDELIWLTSYFYDGCEHEVDAFDNCDDYRVYENGGHGGPYNRHKYVALRVGEFDGVWIKKEHYVED